MVENYLDKKFWGNTIYDYIIALSIVTISILVIIAVKLVVKKKLSSPADEGEARHREFIRKSINKFLVPFLLLGGLYFALEALTFSTRVSKVITVFYYIAAAWFVVRFLIAAINFSILKILEKTRSEEERKKIKPLLSFLNFLIWIAGLLFLLDNLGFNISTVVAGLGIGGIAIALAAQALLGDLFSYFVIFFDRPFELGDFIVFDNKRGTIENIGIKTTKIRSLDGEIIIVSNSSLTNSRVHNFKKLVRRRISFKVGVTYQTPPEKLKSANAIIKSAIDAEEKATFDRSHFFAFSDSSLDFETVYYVESPDYIEYMDIQQRINLKIYEEFGKAGIEFAYPTQTIYVSK